MKHAWYLLVVATFFGCYSGPGDPKRGVENDTFGGTDSGDDDQGSERDADDESGPMADDSEGALGGQPSPSDGGDFVPPAERCGDAVVDPGPNLVRRLTAREYANAVSALTGVSLDEQALEELPADLRADGFSNTRSGLIVTLDHVEAYERLSSRVTSRIDEPEHFADNYTSCFEFADDCESEFVRELGLRAFRRPVTMVEHESLSRLFRVAEFEGDTFHEGAMLVLQAMLQSPAFLYRLEDETRGTDVRGLDSWEMATRLSFTLLAGPPDEGLLAAAANDALRGDDEIEAQVRRLLLEPQAEAASRAFVYDWLNLGRLENLQRDEARFPDWSPAIGSAMVEETLGFFSSVGWRQERPLKSLFDAQEAWLSPQLAEHYGLAAQGEAWATYDLSDVPQRGGLLTQGSLLTIGGSESSMVSRGLFVFETLLCQYPVSPPEGVDTTPPVLEPGRSQRFYSDERTSNPACQGCHLQFEPLAWGLERYLADGTYATTDAFGNELREDGTVRLPGETLDASYETAAELMLILSNGDQINDCVAEKAMQYALGRSLSEDDACTLASIQDGFRSSDGTWADLVVAITLSPGFRSIRAEDQ